ncbi:ricin-type beta-trefoil lectin domain protein (plasmid) [Streptomyces sp. NBC_01340]|uniref:RICIN domain-containing protein n=1 Tax=unclassified Streptomyces TaxID=2593676 RepID=UPI00224EE763|nr:MULTISPECIES: RICIN domain-containing protein [unclassified Streptomyces]MCX4460796.1 ricin-type beta-trefoil lectin domain protein [Streptomyces sp. NBC_01719]MCX4499874.1 ricin-type beta-trefoil lectin domain protein [Streptomyces sp. NBC_01728]WSI45003.1 ricin-type beta-trefoil lectin domain protein [Streptomyces sp. NBC_01340]
MVASAAPAASGSGTTRSAPAATPDNGDDSEGADGGPGRFLRLLVARAGTAMAARSSAESPEVQPERNVRLIGVMTAVSVLAALGLGTVAFMSAPDGEVPQPRAARVEDGPVPTAGPGDSVLPSDSASPSSSAAAHRKDGAPRVTTRVAEGGDSRAAGPSSAGAAPRSTHGTSSGAVKTVDAADSSKSGSKGATSQTRSTPATTSTHVEVAGDMIVGYGSSRCVGVSAHAGTDGSPLTLQGCADEAWQKWVFASDGSVRSMGMCLDIAYASTDNGATIQLARCNGGWAQKFTLNSSHDLVNTQIGKCVDAKDMGTAAGTRLQLWECGGTSNQKWHLG